MVKYKFYIRFELKLKKSRLNIYDHDDKRRVRSHLIVNIDYNVNVVKSLVTKYVTQEVSSKDDEDKRG